MASTNELTKWMPRHAAWPGVWGAALAALLGLQPAQAAGCSDGGPATAAAPAPAAAARAGATARNRLKAGTRVQFDLRRGTVGEAINFLLEPVHYRVTHRTVDARASAAVLRRPIPPVAANAGVMTIEDALLLLIGDEHRLVVDHAHRLIAIERMPADAAAAR